MNTRILVFGAVGLAATLTYAGGALALRAAGLGAVSASALAYSAAFALSYLGHRRLTFRSSRAHGEALPRFAMVSLAGYAVSILAPLVLDNWLGAPPAYAIALACVAVPTLNFLGMDRLVYRTP